jgi:hypothetical protein
MTKRRFVSDERSNIGNVLLDLGAITEEQLAVARDKQQTLTEAARLGRILVDEGTITEAELEEALDLQKQMRNGRAVDAMLNIVEKRTRRVSAFGAFPKTDPAHL